MKTLFAALGCAALLAGCATYPGDYYSYNNYGTPYAYGYDYGPAYYGPGYPDYGYYGYGPAIGFSYYGGHYHDGHDHRYDHYHAYSGDHWHAAASAGSVGHARVVAPSRPYARTYAPPARVATAPRVTTAPHAMRGNVAHAQHQRPSVAHARAAPEHDHS